MIEKENKKLSKKFNKSEESNTEPVWFNKDNQKEELTKEEQMEVENLFKEFK